MSYTDLYDLNAAGVRWEIVDTPLCMRTTPQTTPPQESITRPRTPTMIVPPTKPVETLSIDVVEKMAARPTDIQSLIRMIMEFNHPLRTMATNVVLPHIAPNPNGMIVISDIPSSDDDAGGKILSGAAGQLFDKMLTAIGMTRDNVSIIPMLFWRTPGGRTPTDEELALCRPFIDKFIQLLSPRVILTLGTLPAAGIGGVQLLRAHGTPVAMDSGCTVLPIYHPNYLILKPSAKRDVWNALQRIQNLLKNQ